VARKSHYYSFYIHAFNRSLHLKDDILKIVQSNELNIIRKYLADYVLLLQNQIDQLTAELSKQSHTCPSTLSPLKMIDQRLKEFVRLHHLDLLRTVNYQLSKLNSNILITKFSKQLSTFHLTAKQV
jgi:hypothetical protein